MNITNEPLFIVTEDKFEEGDEYPDPVHQTDWHRAKYMYIGKEMVTPTSGVVTTLHHAVYTNPDEALREAIRRLRNKIDAMNRKVKELEADLAKE